MPRPRTRRQEGPIDFDEGLPSTATPVEDDPPPRRRLSMENRPQAGRRHKNELDFGDDPPEIREAVSKGEQGVEDQGGDDGEPGAVEKVVWSTKRINGFPDSSFLHIKPGGKKDSEGKTVPRTLRMFPVRDETGRVDLPHVRNAIARAPQASVPKAVQDKVQAAARKLLDKAKAGDIQTTASKASDHSHTFKIEGQSVTTSVNPEGPGHTVTFAGKTLKTDPGAGAGHTHKIKVDGKTIESGGPKAASSKAAHPDPKRRRAQPRRRRAAGDQAKGAVPEVLTWEAVRANQLPSLGLSGLPDSLEQDVPPEYRYWKCKDGMDALLVREALVETRAFNEDTLREVDGELRRVDIEWVQKLYLPPPVDEIREDLEPAVPEALPPVAKAALMLSDSPNRTTLFPHEIVKAIGLDVVLEGTGKLKTDWVVAAEDTPEVRKAMGEGFKLPNYGDLVFATNAEVEDPDDDLEWFEYSRAEELIKHAFREGREIPMFKFDTGEEERTILGIVMEPNEVDSQDDKVSAEEIRQAAHKFMEHFGNLGKQHGEIVNGKLVLLETYIAPVTFDVEGQHVKKGSWLFLERVVDDELWAAVKKGEFTGFSIGGSAVRKPVR